MRITLRIDDDNVKRAMRRLRAAAKDMTPAMEDVAGYLEESTKRRFFTKTAPDGETWARLSRVTQRRRLKKGRKRNDKLIFSGRLVRSIRSNFDGRRAVVGTDVPYASTHQFGAKRGEYGSFTVVARTIQGKYTRVNRRTPKRNLISAQQRRSKPVQIPWGDIPARPFFGLSADDRNEIGDIIRRHLLRATE